MQYYYTAAKSCQQFFPQPLVPFTDSRELSHSPNRPNTTPVSQTQAPAFATFGSEKTLPSPFVNTFGYATGVAPNCCPDWD
jgi:hypothetical protein